jgi:flagellar M-ring protein FliF
MNQILQLFRRLTIAQRIWLAAATLAVIGGIAGLAHWNQERDFKPLFTGIAPEDAGALLARLREGTVEYRLADNGTTVLVPSARVAELRIEMASAGLPKSGRIGFELFDKANFGASEFAEQVNYHRAIEGELERSVMSIREVEQARVHITLAKDSLYTETRQAAKASVLVKLRHAAALSAQNIAAICQLTASAVPGLSADQVSLVDTNGNLLNRPRASAPGDGSAATEASLDYRKSVEHDLQSKVTATLEPLLGAEHFRTGVSADVDISSAEQSEELFDPNKSVMVTSQHTEDRPAQSAASGVPGTPSNLPRPTSRPATGASNYSRQTENISYQTSRTVKHTRLPQGGVRRLSISVLVDHTLRWEGEKRVIEPPSAEKLKVIKDLVMAAAGLDTNRGDQLVVEAFPFEATLMAEPVNLNPPPATAVPPSRIALPAWIEKLKSKNVYVLIGVGAGALAALAAGFVMMRRRSRERRVKAEMTGSALEAAQAKQITPADVEREMEGKLAERSLESARQEAEALMALKLPVVKTKKTEVLTKHIAAEAKKDPSLQAQVVRTWLRG